MSFFLWMRKLITTHTHTPSHCLKFFNNFFLVLGYNLIFLFCGLQDPVILFAHAHPLLQMFLMFSPPYSLWTFFIQLFEPAVPLCSGSLLQMFLMFSPPYSLWTFFIQLFEPAVPLCSGSLHKLFLLSGGLSPSPGQPNNSSAWISCHKHHFSRHKRYMCHSQGYLVPQPSEKKKGGHL